MSKRLLMYALVYFKPISPPFLAAEDLFDMTDMLLPSGVVFIQPWSWRPCLPLLISVLARRSVGTDDRVPESGESKSKRVNIRQLQNWFLLTKQLLAV